MTLGVQAGGVSYTVKVKSKSTQAKTYLFGSDTVKHVFDARFTIVFRVDPEGATVTIWAAGPGSDIEVCTLQPAQAYALQLVNLKAVWAVANEDLRVHCAIVAAS